MWKKYLGFGDVCEEVNQDLRVKRVKRNVGLGVKLVTMYGTNQPRCLINDTR